MRCGNKEFFIFKLLESVKHRHLPNYIVKRTTVDNAFEICSFIFS